MKLITILLLFCAQTLTAQTTLSDSGFGEIRLGKSFESVEDRLNVVDVHAIPEYAWYAPMSLNYWITEVEPDTASYYEMLETDRLVAESLNLKIVWCTFSKKKEANFFNSSIAGAQLIFEKNELRGMIVVFDKDEITEDVKEQIYEQFESVFGVATEENSAVSPPRRFDSNWKQNGIQIRLSDAETMSGGTGESVQILFWRE